MVCMLMLSQHLRTVYGGIGDTILMAGGAVIPTMAGDGTAGMARTGTLDSAGEAGTEVAGGDIIITILLIMAAGIMEATIGEEAMAGTVEVFIPIAVHPVRLMYIGIT